MNEPLEQQVEEHFVEKEIEVKEIEENKKNENEPKIKSEWFHLYNSNKINKSRII